MLNVKIYGHKHLICTHTRHTGICHCYTFIGLFILTLVLTVFLALLCGIHYRDPSLIGVLILFDMRFSKGLYINNTVDFIIKIPPFFVGILSMLLKTFQFIIFFLFLIIYVSHLVIYIISYN